jgi:hypothetical protein
MNLTTLEANVLARVKDGESPWGREARVPQPGPTAFTSSTPTRIQRVITSAISRLVRKGAIHQVVEAGESWYELS